MAKNNHHPPASRPIFQLLVLILIAVVVLKGVGIEIGTTTNNNGTLIQKSTSSSSSSHCGCCCCGKQQQNQQLPQPPPPPPPPLKVFILSGQSNMQGHGFVTSIDPESGKEKNGTLEWMVSTFPEKFGMLKDPTRTNWTERTDVWITHNRQGEDKLRPEIKQYGNLKPGFGGDNYVHTINRVGVELAFGWTFAQGLNGDLPSSSSTTSSSSSMSKNNTGNVTTTTTNDNENECICDFNSSHTTTNTNTTSTTTTNPSEQPKHQILLLKIAWAAKTLATDFRPPSSNNATTGILYLGLLAHVYKTLDNLNQYFPEYNGSYEFAGFLWHHGWNDGGVQWQADEYEWNMVNFIRDLRTDLNTPNLPFCIAVPGMKGYNFPDPGRKQVINAQFAIEKNAPIKYPDLVGTVKVVETRDFGFGPPPSSPNMQDWHWYANSLSYWLVGEAMGKAMLDMILGKTNNNTTTTNANSTNET